MILFLLGAAALFAAYLYIKQQTGGQQTKIHG